MRDDERHIDEDDILDPEDVNSGPITPRHDAASDVPVPLVMSAAEIDERAQAVEAVRNRGRRDSEDGMR